MNFKGKTMSSLRRVLLIAATVGAISLPMLADASPASAQDVQITGPLAGQPAVRHLRQYRVNRFFVTPSIGYTLQDEFSRALFFGGSIGFHFLDWLGIGVWGGGAPIDIDTDLTTEVANGGQVSENNRLSLPSAAGFPSQVGRIRWGASVQLLFVPLRGKLSLFQSLFVDTDLYILAGVAMFGLQERAPVSRERYDATCAPRTDSSGPVDAAGCLETQSLRAERITPAPMLGVGLSMMFNSFVGLQLEWRAFPFSWNPNGWDVSGLGANNELGGSGFPNRSVGGEDSRVTFNHMVNVGVVIYLPTEVQVTE